MILIAGRLRMGSYANRWYYGQYTRWRINHDIAHGVSWRRVVIAVVIMAIVAPLTTYRATQLRLDESACLNHIRAGETVTDLLASYNVSDIPALSSTISTNL